MKFLAADIGGTYSRLAWSDHATTGKVRELVLQNSEFDTFDAVIAHALESFGVTGQTIEQMTLAVPGPVHTDPVVLTNIRWQFSRDAVKSRFKAAELVVVNDFQAAALGAVLEPYERLKVLNAATPDEGPVVVAGAGTGLGMAWFPRNTLGGLPQATEGGHIDFAPVDEAQTFLHQRLAARYGHVSYERILSGDGLVDTYRFFAGDSALAQTPAEITALADQGNTHAQQTLRTFVAVFATYAGNLALAFNPSGGIYLCGGLAVHLADWFDPTGFMTRYAAKGRMSELVRRFPVFLVTRHNTGLAGAIRLARNATGQTHEQQ